MIADAFTDTRFALSDGEARTVAAQFGTPVYVIDEAHLRDRIRRYRLAAEDSYANSRIAFASKANSTLAVIAVAHSEGCAIDVASEGELRAALAAGIPPSDCHLHGNNKSLKEIEFAISQGVGQIVVDHFDELDLIASNSDKGSVEIMIRLAPGVDPITHEKISTGQADTKFGFNIADGSARAALLRGIEFGLNIAGFHCHVGSQLMDAKAQCVAASHFGTFAKAMREEIQYWPRRVNLGGGLGVRYTSADNPISIEAYCRSVTSAFLEAGFDGVELVHEPGRSLVAESGVTLYRIGVIKRIRLPNAKKTYVAVDGGLADNPRPALYGAKYTAIAIAGNARTFGSETDTYTISGRHCETDLLFPDVALPSDIHVGDLIQVLCTGAYGSSMASNYNRYPRPATVWRKPSGHLALAQKPESFEQVLARDVDPKLLGLG